MPWVRAASRLTAFVLLTLPLMPVQQIFIWVAPGLARAFPHIYHRMLSGLLGFRIRVVGNPPDHGPVLIIGNHVSWIDIVLLSAVMPCSFVAKRQVGGWLFFGSLARLQRTVFVDRERRQGTNKSRNEMTERLKQGDIVVLFPEGTSGDGKAVRPFRSSYFGAAEDPSLPVIPVTLAYVTAWGLPMSGRERPSYAWYGDMDLAPHLWAALKAGPITVEVIFHQPLRHAPRKTMANAAETLIRRSLAEALHGRRETS